MNGENTDVMPRRGSNFLREWRGSWCLSCCEELFGAHWNYWRSLLRESDNLCCAAESKQEAGACGLFEPSCVYEIQVLSTLVINVALALLRGGIKIMNSFMLVVSSREEGRI